MKIYGIWRFIFFTSFGNNPIGIFALVGYFIGSRQTKNQTKQLTKLITKNQIDTLKHIGLIPDDDSIRVNDKGEVVRSVSSILETKYDINSSEKDESKSNNQ